MQCSIDFGKDFHDRESLSEFVLTPTPISIQQSRYPHDNEDFVKSIDVWKRVFEYCQLLSTFVKQKSCEINPVTDIVLNFGDWETAMDRDRSLLECHAHVHFWLDLRTVRHFETLYDHYTLPDDYMWVNAFNLNNVLELEKERLKQQQSEEWSKSAWKN